jgi:signal transduction histidine kinase
MAAGRPNGFASRRDAVVLRQRGSGFMLSLSMRPKVAGLAATWIAAVAVTAALVLAGRQAALERGREDTAALSAVIEQLTARTFQAVYLTLSAVADAHQLVPRPAKNDPSFQQLMERRLADIPFARALFIVGRDGMIVHDTDYPSTPDLSLSDRPYFQAYAEGAARQATVWPPLLSRSGTGWFLAVTDQLTRSEEFEGVVVAALQADHFNEALADIGLGAAHFIALLHRDGTLIASHPARPEHMGTQLADLEVFSAYPPASGGSYETSGGLVPGERIGSYRVVENAPLVVLVSLGKGEVLAGWRRMAAATAIAMLALTVVLVLQVVRLTHEQAQRERERQRQMQVEKLEALGQLTGGIAHDFSNVLQIVELSVDALRTGRMEPCAVEAALENTGRAVRDATAMVDRLLGFSRQKPLSLSKLRFDEWLGAARPLLSQAAGSGVQLAVETHHDIPDVLCDPVELDMALVNLIANARHAMNGRGRVSVRVFPCEPGEAGLPHKFVANPPRFVCVSVADTGAGMTEDVKRRALEPFFTTKGEAGTGLGLSQVYGFMQQIGGSLAIESAPGRGTVVHLYFPVAPAT